ncbi:TonB-dependent siderophore receptor [Synechocystis sp. PCC 7338]|nr:TonB-dependent siderophore receptor [Synechocystis sp. PCC 7338]
MWGAQKMIKILEQTSIAVLIGLTALHSGVALGSIGESNLSEKEKLEDQELQNEYKENVKIENWQQQISQAQIKEVIQIELKDKQTGIELILKTADQSQLIPLIITEDNILIIDILDAVLKLPDGENFIVENPSEQISQITAIQTSSNSLRITVTGNGTVPTAQVIPSSENLILSLTPPINTVESEEEIEIVATQEEEAAQEFFVPNTSVATGTDTPIMDTPFSAQVVSEEVIRSQQAIALKDVLTNVSSVTFGGTTGGRETIFGIRGFGNQFSNTVPILRDGFRLYGGFQGITEVSHLQQVEVLKGPSSILYGQIEPGGVINLNSKKPLDEPFAEVELQLGNQGLVRPRFDISGGLNPSGNLRYRLNGVYSNEASFRDFNQPLERFAYAPIVTYAISDDTDLSLAVEYINDTNPADFGLSSFGDGVAPVPRSRVINDPSDIVNKNFISAGYNLEHRFNENWKLCNAFRYMSYNYDYNIIALPTIVNGPTVTRFFADQDGQQGSYSFYTNAVGKFFTGSVKHELLAGIDYNWSEESILTLFGGPTSINVFDPDYNAIPKPNRSDLPLFGDTFTSSNRLGIYLQDQVSLLENLILVAGLRYDTITQNTNNLQTDFNQGGNTLQTDSAVTPRMGLLYRPIPEISFFSNYSQSFTPNSGIDISGNPLEPERGEGFEIGVKAELFEQQLLTTLTYFNINKNNVAVSDPVNPLFLSTIGTQQSQGIELDIVGEILSGWKIISNYSYINAKVTEDTDPNFVDNRLFGIPYNMANLWTTYEIQSGALQGLAFGIGFNYVGDRFGDLANTYTVGDYIIGNAAIFYQRDKYRVALNLRNFTNANYVRAVSGLQTGIEPGEPFTIIGSFSVQF